MAKLNAISQGSIYRPSVKGNSKLLNTQVFQFNSDSFTNMFVDPMKGNPGLVKLISLPYLPLLQGGEILLNIGDTFNAITAQNVGIVLEDKYAIHNGVLYEFTQSIDAIIAEQLALGRRLIDNWQGVLVFLDPNNLSDLIAIHGTGIREEDLQFKFTVTSTQSGLESNEAIFSLLPWENVNLKPNYILTTAAPAPEAGDVYISGFTVSTVGTTRTAVIRRSDNIELTQSWEVAAEAVVNVEDLNTYPNRKAIAAVNAQQIFETLTALVQPVIDPVNPNTIIWKYQNEAGIVQEVSLNLTPLLPADTDINIDDFYWDLVDPNILFLVETDNTVHEVSFAQYQNSAVVNPDGSVDLFQGDTLILNLSKVAITNNYNDLINLPSLGQILPPGRKDQIYYITEEGTNEVVPDWMMRRGVIVQTEKEYVVASTAAVNLEEVFKSWQMFSHHNGKHAPSQYVSPPYFPALNTDINIPSQLLTADEFYNRTAWGYDSVNDRIFLSKNYDPYTGFLSPREFSNYTFEATFSSPNSDDDWMALVIGFWVDPVTGYEHTLSVVRTMATLSGQGKYNYALVRNFSQMTEEVIIDATPLAPIAPGSAGGWNTNGPTRVSIVRTFNNYVIKTSQFGSEILDNNTILNVNLDDYPTLQDFKVASKVAFAAKSQQDAYFSDIVFTGLIDYIFWDHGAYYETYEYDPATLSYFLQNPRIVTAKGYFGANRFVESYMFNKVYHITGDDDIVNIKGDSQVSWDPNNALTIGTDLRPFLNVALLGGGNTSLENKVFSIDVAHVQNHEYDVTASWIINGNTFTLKKRFNHGPADATNDTIIVYALTDTGDILALTEGPAANPIKAAIDPTTQIEGTFIIIEAATTQPSGVTSALVYNENTQVAGGEFNTSNYPASSTRFNLAAQTIPSLGTKVIEGTNLQLYDAVEFIPAAPFPIANYERMLYDFRQKPGSYGGMKNPTHRIQFHGTDAQGSFQFIYLQDDPTFDLANTSTYQNLIAKIPASLIVNVTKIRFLTFAPTKNGYGFYLDNIKLSGGVAAPQPTGNYVTPAQLQSGLDTKVDKVAGKGLSDTNYTQAEKDKLATMEGTKFKGTFLNTTALNTAWPSGQAGWYADVDAGAGVPAKRYIWDAQEGWVSSTGTIAGETAESIRTKYLSNAGTEEFTTAYKDKLDSITAIFTTALKTAYDNASTWVTTNGQNVLNHLTKWVTPTTAGKMPRTLAGGAIEWIDTPSATVAEPTQVTKTTTTSFTSETLSDGGYSQNGKNVLIANSTNAINITVGATANFVASYQKEGTGAITFLASSGKTIRAVDATAVLNGAVGSTATVSVVGNVVSLRISNAV